MDPHTEKYLPWFILKTLPHLTPRRLRQLIRHFSAQHTCDAAQEASCNTAAAILNASEDTLKKIDGITPKIRNVILNHARYKNDALYQLKSVRSKGLCITVQTDEAYPDLLREIPDPPLLLISDGKLSGDEACISIVGSRKATAYGLDTARYLALKLAECGFTIVSGMALGIDTAAHQGALAGSGRTMAVLGAGHGHLYPRQNKGLSRDIRDNGAVITEYFPDTPPLPAYFPQRNRIIAGLSVGTVVVEAARRSGSLITARLAGEYNREVFAVPGSVRSANSRGTHALIKQGGHLVENEMDIIDELGQFVHAEPKPASHNGQQKNHGPVMDKVQMMVYKRLDPYPKHIDTIIASTGLTSGSVSAALLDMEMSGLILRHPGNYYSKSEE
ncbi:MAG TPA: DNA-protecting protein DprA [Desulfobacteraceae bacterium]|nr:DNA-protecting protein DprA [Desulfobacteraceae bacterium]|tara:strand:- start:1131 stop:2294 length:1164 start_codon:yes stop_codon:yes gene_type:complete